VIRIHVSFTHQHYHYYLIIVAINALSLPSLSYRRQKVTLRLNVAALSRRTPGSPVQWLQMLAETCCSKHTSITLSFVCDVGLRLDVIKMKNLFEIKLTVWLFSLVWQFQNSRDLFKELAPS
jgi:hypothetical protein